MLCLLSSNTDSSVTVGNIQSQSLQNKDIHTKIKIHSSNADEKKALSLDTSGASQQNNVATFFLTTEEARDLFYNYNNCLKLKQL